VAKSQPDVVIHTACTYGRKGESPLQIHEVNVRLGLIILQALLDNNRSSTFINTGTVLSPNVSSYALSKEQFRQWGHAIAGEDHPLRWINVRLQHMYGAGDDPSKFTAHVLHACHCNVPTLELTGGEQARDFIHIDDVVSAYAALVAEAGMLGPATDIDIGSGEAVTVRRFVETIHSLTSSTTRLLFGALPYRKEEAMYCRADISRMAALGWQPKYDLESGLRKTIEMEFAE
jgi:nucleoside-diphosphate-sugar epimerase